MIHFIGVYDYTVILTHLSLISAVFGMTQAIHGDYKTAIFCLALSVLGYLLNILVASKYGGKCTWDELGLPVTETGLALPCGATGRWFSE